MNKVQRVLALATCITALACATGCSLEDVKSSVSGTSRAQAEDQAPTTKIFEPGEHVFNRRYSFETGWSTKKQINVPKGYEVLTIQYTIESFSGNAYTKGFDVWFVNTETVEATMSTIEIAYGKTQNGYYDPGKVVEKEMLLVMTPSE